MPQLFALEWDPREIRLMVASGRGRQVVIEQAFSIPCETDPSAADTAEQIGRRIAAELDDRGLGRAEAIVAVGRNSIELRQLQLPPAPDEDLPDLVRFQATREFNELDDKWLLDFVPIDGSAETPRTVLATAIAPAVLGQIEAVCAHAGLKMRRLLLRPCEAALLLEGEKSIPRGQVVLLVDPLGVEADLTAVVDGTAVFLRTTRIVSDPPPLQALLAEIRLTMAAASNQLGGRKIESIVLCGKQQAHIDLAGAIEKELQIHVELFDPFSGVNLGRALIDKPPEYPGRFAPLVGMLLAELKPSKHAVDFLHPRRRAAPPNPRKKWIIAGAVAGSLLAVWLIYSRIEHFLLESAVTTLEREKADLDKEIEHANKAIANTGDIAKWATEDVIWLDRIYELEQGFPPPEEAVLNQLTAITGKGKDNTGKNGEQITLKGRARGLDGIVHMGKGISDHGGKMSIRNTSDDSAVPPYSVSFEVSVLPEKGEKP
jgi:Tfp pilus assembly PilM family ATPase